jgi:hypothetical protein
MVKGPAAVFIARFVTIHAFRLLCERLTVFLS